MRTYADFVVHALLTAAIAATVLLMLLWLGWTKALPGMCVSRS